MSAVPDALEELLRVEGGRVLATLIRLCGDIDLAEDAVQDAMLIALERWQRDGAPGNPGAWLTVVARRRVLDRIRRETARRRKEEVASTRLLDDIGVIAPAEDDQLRLLFMCCHPALSADARVALALRTLCGLTTAEIAAAFVVPEPTIGQRVSRAKRKIATAGIPFRIPEDHELPTRLPDVLATIYLVFTTGHHAPAGALDARVDLAEEAVRLARLLVALMPDEPDAAGLLALVLATHARRHARTDAAGELILLADQDRSRWDHDAIAEADRLVEATLRRRRVGPYQIKAAIATLHGLAPTFADTDWRQIAELYRLLERYEPTPVVRVNRAVAEAEVDGPAAGLAVLDTMAPEHADWAARWHLAWSTRADFLRRLHRHDEAAAAYRRALACQPNDSDRAFLRRRLAELTASITN